MFKLIFTNSRGESAELFSSPYRLIRFDGLGDVIANHQTQKSPFLDGATLSNTTLEERHLEIELKITAKNELELAANRRKLVSIFNPKLGQGTLKRISIDGTHQLRAIAETVPFFPDGSKNRTRTFQKTLIQLYCPNPFWQDIKETETDLVTWIPNLEFPEGEGFYTEQSPNYWLETGDPFEEFLSEFGIGTPAEFGYREINQIVEIDNTGDVDCPIKVVFRASGDVVKPYIQNVETRELLRINKTLKMGDILEITTEFGNKNVYLNGEKAHHYLDFLNSTWLQLEPGLNLIKYDAEHGLTNLECSIYHTPQYLGV